MDAKKPRLRVLSGRGFISLHAPARKEFAKGLGDGRVLVINDQERNEFHLSPFPSDGNQTANDAFSPHDLEERRQQ